ncbi:MAG: 30S ribosomal protein S17 [Phycisphaeraceae bacterium]|nr:30S ribosomal protein S17 [Phycisphaeraceae bacterium]
MTQKAPKPLTGTKIGVVSSDKRDKSRTVVVNFLKKHPKYGKYMKMVSRYQVHDPANTSRVGDQVEIANCRPISKTKSWRLIRVVTRAPGGEPVVTEAGAAESV